VFDIVFVQLNAEDRHSEFDEYALHNAHLSSTSTDTTDSAGYVHKAPVQPPISAPYMQFMQMKRDARK
jgi:hypothetical protein